MKKNVATTNLILRMACVVREHVKYGFSEQSLVRSSWVILEQFLIVKHWEDGASHSQIKKKFFFF